MDAYIPHTHTCTHHTIPLDSWFISRDSAVQLVSLCVHRDVPTTPLSTLCVHRPSQGCTHNPTSLPVRSQGCTYTPTGIPVPSQGFPHPRPHRNSLLNPYSFQFPSLPFNHQALCLFHLFVLCILSPTDFVTYPHAPGPLTDSSCLSQTRSGYLRLSDHHPNNAAQPTHPSHSVCSYQSPRSTPALASIFRTVSYDPVLKRHVVPFPVLVVY